MARKQQPAMPHPSCRQLRALFEHVEPGGPFSSLGQSEALKFIVDLGGMEIRDASIGNRSYPLWAGGDRSPHRLRGFVELLSIYFQISIARRIRFPPNYEYHDHGLFTLAPPPGALVRLPVCR